MSLRDRTPSKTAHVSVIGLGYVGLPLAVTTARAGSAVTSFDVDRLDAGKSYAEAVSDTDLGDVGDKSSWTPILAESGLTPGKDLFIGFSPECEARAMPTSGPRPFPRSSPVTARQLLEEAGAEVAFLDPPIDYDALLALGCPVIDTRNAIARRDLPMDNVTKV